MTQFLFITDLDNTLVGDDDALAALSHRLRQHRQMHGTKVVYSTGRSPTSYQQLYHQKNLLPPDAVVTGVGTAIYYNGSDEPDPTWATYLSQGWDRDCILAITAHFADLTPQPDVEQGRFKVSFYLEEAIAVDVLPQLETALKEANLTVNVIYSGGKDLDILPRTANKGLAMAFLRQQWQFNVTKTVACGDSGNDRALFSIGDERGIIVGNAQPELLQWHYDNPSPYRYLATASYSEGILEGLRHFGFL